MKYDPWVHSFIQKQCEPIKSFSFTSISKHAYFRLHQRFFSKGYTLLDIVQDVAQAKKRVYDKKHVQVYGKLWKYAISNSGVLITAV